MAGGLNSGLNSDLDGDLGGGLGADDLSSGSGCNLGDLGEQRGLSVFDLACGNLRFEAFLAAALPQTKLVFHAVDDCDGLVSQAAIASEVNYQNLDILDVLQKGGCLREHFAAPACDLSVSFGFMHHVPLQEYREEILSSLIGQTRPGGYLIVSFWQFLKSENLRSKAQATHRRALKELGPQALGDKLELGTNDYLLGWNDVPGAYRYCHSFTQTEIDQLAHSVAHEATKVASFASDGRTNNLNTYLVLRTYEQKGTAAPNEDNATSSKDGAASVGTGGHSALPVGSGRDEP